MSPRAVLLLLSITLVVTPLSFAADDDLSLDQLLANYYEAIGGKEAWKALRTIRQIGTLQMGPMEAPFKLTSAHPNKMRMEFEMQGMTGIQAFDGEQGWMVMPFTGSSEPQPMPQEMIDMMASDLDIEGVLIDYEEKGHQLELVGREEIEGTEAYRLKLTMKSGQAIDFFLDAEYFIPIATRAKNTVQGMELEVETTISDYKEVGGLMIPHSISSKTGMGDQVLSVDKVEIGLEVDESIFAMPKTKNDG